MWTGRPRPHKPVTISVTIHTAEGASVDGHLGHNATNFPLQRQRSPVPYQEIWGEVVWIHHTVSDSNSRPRPLLAKQRLPPKHVTRARLLAQELPKLHCIQVSLAGQNPKEVSSHSSQSPTVGALDYLVMGYSRNPPVNESPVCGRRVSSHSRLPERERLIY